MNYANGCLLGMRAVPRVTSETSACTNIVETMRESGMLEPASGTPVASALLLRPSRAEATTRRPNRTVSTGELRATPGVGQTMRILPVDPRAEKGKKPARTRFATSERQKTKRCASSESLDARGLLGIH